MGIVIRFRSPALISTSIVVCWPFGPFTVTRYFPAASLILVGVDRFSSDRSIALLFPALTIFSRSPQGDADRRSMPCPAGGGGSGFCDTVVSTFVTPPD